MLAYFYYGFDEDRAFCTGGLLALAHSKSFSEEAISDDHTLDESVSLALSEISSGRAIIVSDDEGRENEGDLIMAAEHASESWVAFFIRHTSGILTTALSGDRASFLNFPPMVSLNEAPLGTAFTVSVDFRSGLTTGISAKERSATIRAIALSSCAEDFVRPGHVFPLIAKSGGVLERCGHTEAAYDLARLSGLRPAGLLAEIVNDDGTVARSLQLAAFSREHNLHRLSIETLVRWRRKHGL